MSNERAVRRRLPALERNPVKLRELIGFVFVGGSGAVAFVVLSSLLVSLDTGVPAWIVSALTWAALIVPVYLGHHRLSFRSGVRHSQGLPRYVAVQISALCFAAAFSYVTYSVFHLRPLYASVIVSVLTAGVNFVVLKLWAFAAPASSLPPKVDESR
jgi:putative flippase GtrA